MDEHRQSLLPVFVVGQLEKAANRALKYAPLTRVQMAKLRGHSIKIQLQRPNFPIHILIERRQIRFSSQWDEPSDATLSGPTVALLRQLGREQSSPAELMKYNIQIEGDQEIAQQFIKLIKELDIDFESILGDFIGDMAAHQLGEVARGSLRWLKHTAKTVAQQTRHFLAEERALVVQSQEFEHFQASVDTLREDTDRMEARIRHLARNIPAPEATELQAAPHQNSKDSTDS